MKKLILLCLVFFLFYGQSYAQEMIADGTYVLNDNRMDMTITIQAMPDGKYFVHGSGTNKDGKTCRIGDLAELRGNKFFLGPCQMDIYVSGDKFELNDSGKCIACETGAYVSGTYRRK